MSDLWNNKSVSVILSIYNGQKQLNRCFESIEKAARGHDWAMFIGDDASTDNTPKLIEQYKSRCSAKVFVSRRFSKASGAGQAKNRAIKLAIPHRKRYPAFCFMDHDDEMGEDRISLLLDAAVKANHGFVVGDYVDRRCSSDIVRGASRNVSSLKFGPWATLIHERLIPDDGKFFSETMDLNEDILKWWEMRHEYDIDMLPVDGVITNYYYRHASNSYTSRRGDKWRTKQKKKLSKLLQKYRKWK